MNKNRIKTAIVGAGASGMMAAVAAAQNGAYVTLTEHNDRVGKKILLTGNGRCNITNMYQSEECYRSDNTGFQSEVLNSFNTTDTLDFFDRLGIYPKNKNGYIYPNSEQASAVLDVLRMELLKQKINLMTNTKVISVNKKDSQFIIKTSQGEIISDRLIIAAGSKAYSKTGSDGSGYELAKGLGHSIIKPLPALVQLRCEGSFKTIAGVRCEAELSLICDGRTIASDRGELQITDYGISGIPTFQISRYAVRLLDSGNEVFVNIDLFPNIDRENFTKYMNKRVNNNLHKSLEDLLIGLINKKLITAVLKRAHLPLSLKCSELTNVHIFKLCSAIKNFKVKLNGYNSFDSAQVCSGGVDTREVDNKTLESRLVKGLYFAGEILDVDGICGGYNLQWAWSSGMAAGLNSSKPK